MSIQDWENKAADYSRLKQERDELAALAEFRRIELEKYRGQVNQYGECTASDALSITGPDALREIQARTLEEAALLLWEDQETAKWLESRAADKRKGE